MKKILTISMTLALLTSSLPVLANSSAYQVDALTFQAVTGVEWIQTVNTYGVWSFYATGGYWDEETESVPTITSEGVVSEDKTLTGSGIVHNGYKYGDLSNNSYCTPVKSSWLDSSYEASGTDDIDHNGIRFGLEGEAKSMLLIKPNSYDNRVRFWLDEPRKLSSKKGDIIVCFTVPENGIYNISHELYDEGIDEALSGDGGIVRRTILTDGETFETSQNSEDFIFTKDAPSKESKKTELSYGDKIYIRVSVGETATNDNFYGKVIIDRHENENSTKILQTYDLSKVGMSTAGNWSFMNSQPDNTDYSKYHHMFAYNRTQTGKAEAYSSGANGKRYTVTLPAQVNKAPYVKWSLTGEGVVELKGGSSSGTFLKQANPLIVWTAPQDGLYSLDLGLTADSAVTGSTISVSLLAAGEKEDKNILKTVSFNGGELSSEDLREIGCSMKKDDKLIIRFSTFSGTAPVADAVYSANPKVRRLMENFEATYFKVMDGQETQITDLANVSEGDVIRVKLKGDNILPVPSNVQCYTGIYDGDKLIKTCTADSIMVNAYSGTERTVECVIPKAMASPELRTFIWSDFNKAVPLCDEIYFK